MAGSKEAVGYMAELKALESEIVPLNARIKQLRERKKELQGLVLQYLETVDAPGVKYQDLVVLKKESVTHVKKNKKEKEESVLQVLENSGVENPKELYESITKAMVGDEVRKPKLSMKTTVPELF